MHPSRVLLVLLAVAACAPTAQGPAPTTIASTLPAEAEARSLTFRAENGDVPVAARCQLSGPSLDLSFTTPAVVSVPIDADGTAALTEASCSWNGITRNLHGIPGEDTRGVQVEFGEGNQAYFYRGDGSEP